MEHSASTTRTPLPPHGANTIRLRTWSAFIVLGLAAEIAWTVEGTFLNLFVHEVISDDPNVIATMVAASAATATAVALVFGPISDRIHNKGRLLSVAFFLWGLSTIALGSIALDCAEPAVRTLDAIVLTGFTVVALDCVMSFFGAGAHRAAFHGWVTDISTPANRGRVEALIVTLPLAAMVVSFFVLDHFARTQAWSTLFTTAGIALIIAGALSWWLISESAVLHVPSERLSASILHGLRWRSIRSNPDLYLSIAVLALLSIATTVYFPFLLIYIKRYLGIENYAALLAIIVAVAIAFGFAAGRIIDRVGRIKLLLPSTGLYISGLLLLFVARDFLSVAIAGVIALSGFLLLGASSGGLIRDFSPQGRSGGVQGTRVLLASLPAALLGPFLGAAVIVGTDEYYEHLGEFRQVPTPEIFLTAAIVLLLASLPAGILMNRVGWSAKRVGATTRSGHRG